MNRKPQLLPQFVLEQRDVVDSVLEEGRRLALQGAEEGTLVWAHEQTAGRGRHGQPWVSPRGNFYCSLVLRPDFPLSVALQLNYVAAIALGLTVADLVPAGANLRYRWPNDVLLNEAKVGVVVLELPDVRADTPEWMVVGAAVNINSYPETTPFPAISLEAEGCSDVADTELLEGFSRRFLSWINRWADEGFSPIRKFWVQRANGMGATGQIRLKNETLLAKLIELDENGALSVELADGERRLIGVLD